MASNAPEAMRPRPTILSPASPTELLTYVLSHCRHPATIVVGCSRQDFVAALSKDALPPAEPGADESPQKHPLLQQTLLQIAVSRHVRMVFTSSVTHFRVWTAVFSPAESKIPAPPAPQSSESPVLLAYGLVALHRDTSEWSAQGLGASAASFVEAAARHGFKAVLVEPKEHRNTEGSTEEGVDPALDEDEKLPLLKGIARRHDGTWSGRTIELRKVLGRWFEYEQPDEV